MTDIHASLGLSQLKRLDSVINERHRLYDRYIKELDGLPLEFLEVPHGVISSLHLAVIRLLDRRREHHCHI